MREVVANTDIRRVKGVYANSRFGWVPYLTSLAFILPVALLYCQLGGPTALLTDPNTGVHVRAGDWIVAHRAVPRQDLFSFALAGRHWCDWEWLSDLVFALLHRWGGLPAIAAFSLALLCLISIIVYRTARLHAGAAVAFSVTCLIMAATTIHWLARPHLFTWLLVAGFCWVIERARMTGSVKLLFVLPVLMLFWVNLHPGFLAGLFILAVWCATEAVRRRVPGTAEERVAHGRRWAHWLALTGFACLVATFANPYRTELHRHIISYLFSPTSVTANVAEWMSPDFHNPRLHWFELLLPLGGAASLWHGLRRRLAWCALTLGLLHLALSSVRNVPIFAIVCAAPVAGLFDHLIRQCGFESVLHAAEVSLVGSRIGTFVCYAAAAMYLITVVSTRSLRLGPDSTLPIEAVARVPPGRLFTTDRWGDYIIYAEPGRQVFFDCRNDLYGPQFVSSYQTVMSAAPDWQEVLRRYGLTVVLAPAKSPISAALAASADWRRSYGDATAAVFVSENESPRRSRTAALSCDVPARCPTTRERARRPRATAPRWR